MQHKNRNRSSRRLALILSAALLALVVLTPFGLLAVNQFFPENSVASCTVEDRSERHRGAFLRGNLYTDCGRFRGQTQVECSSDPAQSVTLAPNATYELVVRGPRVPLLSTPTLVSATVSQTQVHKNDPELPKVSPNTDENLQELQQATQPETLRAFDYEQPRFDPSCDVNRMIMTTNGIQQVSPAQAERLLRVPAGETAQSPLLACEGHQCAR